MAKKEKVNKVSIGGQAVLEGVMMRGKTAMATAVRDEDGIIRLETKRLKENKNFFLKLPIVRGVVSFVQSMFGGTAVLMRSADVYGESEPSKFEKWMAEKLKLNVMSVVGGVSLVLGLMLAVFLFMWLPQTLRELLEKLFSTEFDVWVKNFIEGGLKLAVFVSYILLTSLMKDIRRTFMYHGAEHKTITCYEKGLPLTVENAKKCKRVHDRCGTTFIVLVILISLIFFACFESFLASNDITLHKAVRVLCKIAFLPIISGLSYELLKALSKTDFFLLYPLRIPGLLLQRITTREPDDKMLEVAITAFKKVLEMDNDQTIAEVTFTVPKKRKEVLEDVKSALKNAGIDEDAEAEWIVSLTLKVKREELNSDKLVSCKNIDEVNKIVNERITGRPLWYCIGDTEFYGYKIKVDERCLIPRPETELLAEQVIKLCNKDGEVLDLCTGSGAIAVAVAKETSAVVTASDISENALEIAKENAKINDAKIEFLSGDMFASVKDRKFDMIVSNPPYIKREDIDCLQKEVKEFEPSLALDGGEDGLDFYRLIAKEVKGYLKEGGVLLLECGFDQAEEIKGLLKDAKSVEIIKDYENIERIVKAVF